MCYAMISGRLSRVKRTLLKLARVIAAIAAMVFIFCPVSTATQVIVFMIATVVMVGSSLVAGHWDETNTGYWPEPIDWSPRSDAKSDTEAPEQ